MQRVAGQKRRRPATGERERPRRGPIRSWFARQRDDLVREGLIGALLLVVGTVAVFVWDSRVAERQEVLENTRFVRQVVIDDVPEMPFNGLNLSGASLAGLDLACEVTENGEGTGGCATLSDANLSDADLKTASLYGADLTRANLTGADLSGVDMRNANLAEADLTGADLGVIEERENLYLTSLVGAYLAGADLRGADLTGVCHDDTTTWPADFTVQGSPHPLCQGAVQGD